MKPDNAAGGDCTMTDRVEALSAAEEAELRDEIDEIAVYASPADPHGPLVPRLLATLDAARQSPPLDVETLIATESVQLMDGRDAIPVEALRRWLGSAK